jgi:hypothetical protein
MEKFETYHDQVSIVVEKTESGVQIAHFCGPNGSFGKAVVVTGDVKKAATEMRRQIAGMQKCPECGGPCWAEEDIEPSHRFDKYLYRGCFVCKHTWLIGTGYE